VIEHPAFAIEPWSLREVGLDLDVLAQTESLFALSNGHLGVRGNLDEGEPQALPGSYLNGFFERRRLPYAEAGYGYPESGETVVNVPNGKLIRLAVDDEPFDVRYGELDTHERVLDFRAGTLTRNLRWTSPAGVTVAVTSTRLVSLTLRGVMAIRYEVRTEQPARIAVQSELLANEPLPMHDGHDARAVADLRSPLRAVQHGSHELTAELLHTTRRSRLHVGAAMDHVVTAPGDMLAQAEAEPDLGRVTLTTLLAPGEVLRIVKFVAYGWSARRSVAAVRDQVAAALSAARQTGWDGLLEEQRANLDEFWKRADVEVDGDPEMQQAVRFALFHLLQSGARGERRAIPAKGLTGPGYDGHTFWDNEAFVLRVLTYTHPAAVADALRWRHATMPAAKERAEQLGLSGVTFPWRTIDGAECSGYWPAGTAAFHVNADISDAVMRYVAATGDTEFERTTGLDILVETARLWCSLGHYDSQRRFRIDGVTGPDEYSAVADNNVYTNLMAQRNLRGAAETVLRHAEDAERLGVAAEEVAGWAAAADAMYVPYDPTLRVHPQADGFTLHQVWNFASTAPEQYPLLLHFPYFDLYRKQVVKQADLVLAMELRGDAFTREDKTRNFAYYEALTVRDSSLSAGTQGVLAAELGHLDLAYDYLWETALTDLDDLQHNTRDGLHVASLAGTWLVLVCGFGGLRDHGDVPSFAPRLPANFAALTFNLAVRGARLRVEIRRDAVTYVVEDGDVTFRHCEELLSLAAGERAVRAVPSVEAGTAPDQPPGRRPGSLRRRS
jgi:alpha,alpha-trehalose phosphorylase